MNLRRRSGCPETRVRSEKGLHRPSAVGQLADLGTSKLSLRDTDCGTCLAPAENQETCRRRLNCDGVDPRPAIPQNVHVHTPDHHAVPNRAVFLE